MGTPVLIGQIGLPDGVPGADDGKAIVFKTGATGPQDYVLSTVAIGAVTAANITDATATGRTVIKGADAAAIRTTLGATATGTSVFTAADAAAARTAIGAGTSSLAIGTTGTTAKAGDYAPTKSDVGLANVDNTSDANKPISTAATTALAGKEPTITVGTSAQYYRGDKTMQTLNKAAVGLSSVDNTTDLGKPISTATQAALDLKVGSVSPAFTGTPTGITKTHVGLGNVDNTADTAKPVSMAQQAALDLKVDLTDEIAEADLIDEADTALGLISGRRMAAAVAALTGDVQFVLWDDITDTWFVAGNGTIRSNTLHIWISTNDVTATAHAGMGKWDLWFKAKTA